MEDFFEEEKRKDIQKLTDVGFTLNQAETLLDLMQKKAFTGGFL